MRATFAVAGRSVVTVWDEFATDVSPRGLTVAAPVRRDDAPMSVIQTILVAADPEPGAESVIALHHGELLASDRIVAAFAAPADAVRAAAALVQPRW